MKEKLNLVRLTKMTKKDLQETKGGLLCRCFCICYIYPDDTDLDNRRERPSDNIYL
jgi:hypothetical protein